MNRIDFPISGPQLIELKTFADNRGFFAERFRIDRFKEIGFDQSFMQENFSRSLPGVLRGLHYQHTPSQGKLVTCVSGKIFDVAVDVRAQSKTFGQHVTVELSGEKPAWFWIPAGFAHGFCVLGDQPADVLYKVDNYYDPKGENGISWNDKDLNIQWPIAKPILSAKDEKLSTFSEYRKNPAFK